MLSMGSSPNGHPKDAPSVCRAPLTLPCKRVCSQWKYRIVATLSFLEQKAAFVRHEAKPQVGTHFLFFSFFNVKNAVVQCEKKAETARDLQTNHCHTSKAKARRWRGGVRVRVRARSCCVSVKWSLSDATCWVVCHCCGCLGGCRWSCCRFLILPLIVSRVPIKKKKKSSLVYIVDVTPDWFTTSLSWSSCMCVSVGACLRLHFLILILLFYSIDASLYFQFVLHFVFRGVAQINTSVGALSVKYAKWLTEMKLHLP